MSNQKTIISTNKIGQSKDGSLCYVSREIIKFNQLNNIEITALVEEKLLSIEPVLDELGEDTGEIQYVTIEDKGKTVTKFPNYLVDALFTSLGEDIVSTDSFSDHFNNLQGKSLLAYTKQINRYGSQDWELKTD